MNMCPLPFFPERPRLDGDKMVLHAGIVLLTMLTMFVLCIVQLCVPVCNCATVYTFLQLCVAVCLNCLELCVIVFNCVQLCALVYVDYVCALPTSFPTGSRP